jgi:hypothetical protein
MRKPNIRINPIAISEYPEKSKVDLQCVAGEPEPRQWCRHFRCRQREQLIGNVSQRVGDQHLLAEAEDEPPNAVSEVGETMLTRGDLGGDVAPADDRSGDQLRKEQDVEREVGKPPLRIRILLVHVDHVRDRVKREKGDAERQMDRRERDRRDSQERHDRVDVGNREVRVLEDRQCGQVRGHAGDKPTLARGRVAGTADCEPEPPVGENRGEHERNEQSFTPDVENKTCDQQQPHSCRAEVRANTPQG